jgi:4-hydroxybenzoate polyprenyltransferase
VAFGLLPAVVTLTAPLGRWPAWWLLAAGSLLGAGAHFANALPDLDADHSTGVRGLPHRLGRGGSLFATVGLVALGIVVVTTALASAALGGLGALLLIAVAVAALRGRDRLAFHGVVVLLLLLAVSVVVGGAQTF